jgi:hypothetical protein
MLVFFLVHFGYLTNKTRILFSKGILELPKEVFGYEMVLPASDVAQLSQDHWFAAAIS